MYKGVKFGFRSVKDIKEDMLMARNTLGREINSIFFPDGNTIVMKTEELEEIFAYAKYLFPNLNRITLYGSARFTNQKTFKNLERLNKAGLKRIHMGMESGDDIVLKKINKGNTSHHLIEAGSKVVEAGIELSMYYLVGAGGKDYWKQHAINSAKALSCIDPKFIRLRTLIPQTGTPIYEAWQSGSFKLLSPHEALEETKLLIQNLTGTGELLSDHISNFWNVSGSLAHDKPEMIFELEEALKIPESQLRPFKIDTL